MTLFLKKHNIALLLPLLLMLVLFPLRASAEDYSCTASIPVRVSLTGEIDTEFAVQISSEEGDPLPEEDVLKIRGSGNATFGAVTYTEPGDYHYTVVQQGGEIPYLTYDDTVYRVTVRVTNNEKGGLTPEIWAIKDEQTEKTAELVFTNVYNPATPTPTPGGEQTPTPGGEQTPTPGGEQTPTPGGQQTPIPGGQPTPVPGTQQGAGTATSVSALLQQFHIPQTGDQFPLILLVVLVCVAAVGFGYSYYRKKHPKKGGSSGNTK